MREKLTPEREAIVAIWHELFALKRETDADRNRMDIARPRRIQLRDRAALEKIITLGRIAIKQGAGE